MSKAEEALKLVEQGMSVEKAARQLEISASAVHAARRKAKANTTCPCCGSKVERSRIKMPAVE